MTRLLAACCLLLAALPAAATTIVASIPPLAMVAQAVADKDATVKSLLPAGASPHDFQLAPSDLETLASADVVVWLGAEAEPWLAPALARPREGQQLVTLARLPGVVLREHRLDAADNRRHGRDPHLWLSTQNAALLARALGARLGTTLAAEHFAGELQRWRSRQQARFAPIASMPLLVAHDAYGYLFDEIGLANVSAVMTDPRGSAPSAKRMNELAQRVQREAIGCMVGEPGFADRVGTRLFANGHGNLVVLDPMLPGIPPARDAYVIALVHLADTLYGCMVTR